MVIINYIQTGYSGNAILFHFNNCKLNEMSHNEYLTGNYLAIICLKGLKNYEAYPSYSFPLITN